VVLVGGKRMPRPLTISIAMCTYNGERFLQEQLDSFLHQTRLPDELVVCDDGSQDGTGAILEAFAARAPFPVRLFLNPQNLGVSQNFAKAISLCTGEVIALSDQDDVWLPEKLSRFDQVFLRQPQVGCAFCNASLVDDKLQPLGYSIWETIGLTPRVQKQFAGGLASKLIIQRVNFYGAAMAIRSELKSLVLPIPPFWPHDSWLSFRISMIKDIALLPETLNLYRQHPKQYAGLKKIGFRERLDLSFSTPMKEYFGKRTKMFIEGLHILSQDTNLANDKSLLSQIRAKIIHLNARANMPDSRITRIPIVLREAITGRYYRFSNGWKSMVKDLLIKYK
jgi:glycosyltransferase involved in cell wall biosynthesis